MAAVLTGPFRTVPAPHRRCVVEPPTGGAWIGDVIAVSESPTYPVVLCVHANGARGIIAGNHYLVRADFLFGAPPQEQPHDLR